MRPRSNSVNFTGVVREILGTAQSVGCTIDHETPQVMRMMIIMTILLIMMMMIMMMILMMMMQEWLEKIADGEFQCPDE